MSNFSGFVEAAVIVGTTSILIKPNRGIYSPTLPDGSMLDDIIAQAVIEELHIDQLEVVTHPVEQGAAITDHAFKRPAEVVLKMGWSNSPQSTNPVSAVFSSAAAMSSAGMAVSQALGAGAAVSSILTGSGIDQLKALYQKLLQLQASRALFTIYTGKRVYTNMVCRGLATESDYNTENSLPITMECQQLILVNSQTVSLPKSNQSDPSATASPINKGTVSATSSSQYRPI